jgi:hypothetical protein
MNRKNATLVFFVCLFTVTAVTGAAAKNLAGQIAAPSNFLLADLNTAEQVCFSWAPVTAAVKYSVAIKVDVDLDQDGVVDVTPELDFSTNDYDVDTSANPISMCIPRSDIAEDLNGDGIPEVLTGHATAKVKGLNPGKGVGRQNNAFSIPIEFDLE